MSISHLLMLILEALCYFIALQYTIVLLVSAPQFTFCTNMVICSKSFMALAWFRFCLNCDLAFVVIVAAFHSCNITKQVIQEITPGIKRT